MIEMFNLLMMRSFVHYLIKCLNQMSCMTNEFVGHQITSYKPLPVQIQLPIQIPKTFHAFQVGNIPTFVAIVNCIFCIYLFITHSTEQVIMLNDFKNRIGESEKVIV
jgi:hypothetical protein